ncbi:MAG: hypothetical protein K0B10_02930 [Vicingaceae bacterium]|nr:hypothetical protein [Vicingaceae bacterium]
MKNLKLKNFLLLFVVLIFVSCTSETQHEEIIEEQNEPEVLINEHSEITAADTSSTGVYQEEIEEGPTSLKDAMKANAAEVVEEGGLSFCDCVKKQKALNDLIMETEDDAEMDKAMKELEEMKTGECKVLFTAKQNTMDEKQAHQQKVKRCL